MRGLTRNLLILFTMIATSATGPVAHAANSILIGDCESQTSICSVCEGWWEPSPAEIVASGADTIVALMYSGGQWMVIGTGAYAGIPATDVAVRCYYQLNNATAGAVGPVVDLSSSPAVIAYIPPTRQDFTATVNDQVYICATITWTDPDGTRQSYNPYGGTLCDGPRSISTVRDNIPPV
jgi:hypothetical protein